MIYLRPSPYGLKEYSTEEQTKLRDGNRTGMWRIPPTLGGNTRAPLPRFTDLLESERTSQRERDIASIAQATTIYAEISVRSIASWRRKSS